MKRFLLLILFIASALLPAVSTAQSGGWIRILDEPTFDVAVNPYNPNMIIAGGIGRKIWRSEDGGKSWEKLIVIYESGSTQFNNLLIHPRDTNIYLVGGLNFKDFKRTTDRGKTWESVVKNYEGVSLNGKSMELKPDAPDTIYMGDFKSANIYRSIDRGANWDSIGQIRHTVHYKDSLDVVHDTIMPIEIACLQVRSDSTNIIVVGSTWNEMFVSTDGGYNWRQTDHLVTPLWDFRDSEVTRIVFSDRDPRTGYCVITYLFGGNTPNGGLYKTTDGGYNWDQIAFADTSMWTVATRRYNQTDEVFIGGYTEDYFVREDMRIPGIGIVRRSLDGGKTWYSYDSRMDWYTDPFKKWYDLRSVYFLNQDTGFVAGSNGVILHTWSRGEQKWTEYQNSGTTNTLNHIVFVSKRTGFVAGDNGTVLRTTDEGKNWKIQDPGTQENLNYLAFTAPAAGFVVGDAGTILKTSNTGVSWNKLNSNTDKDLYSVFFVNSLNGFVVGDKGTILRTKDGGDNWEKLNSGTGEMLKSVFFVNENIGYVVGSRGILVTTANGGDNWSINPLPVSATLNSVNFPNADSGVIVGDLTTIIRTFDGGKSWTVSDPGSLRRDLNQVFMIDTDYGYISADGTTLLRTYDFFNDKDSPLITYGPVANMWSQRYFDNKLYMATEAGLFVLDNTTSVGEMPFQSGDSRLSAFVTHEQLLTLKYSRLGAYDAGPLEFSLVNILGETVFSSDINEAAGPLVNREFVIPHLAKGIYACRMTEGSTVTTQMIIIE